MNTETINDPSIKQEPIKQEPIKQEPIKQESRTAGRLSLAIDKETKDVVDCLRDTHHVNISGLVRSLLLKELNRIILASKEGI